MGIENDMPGAVDGGPDDMTIEGGDGAVSDPLDGDDRCGVAAPPTSWSRDLGDGSAGDGRRSAKLPPPPPPRMSDVTPCEARSKTLERRSYSGTGC